MSDEQYARMATDEAMKSQAEGEGKPLVGVVIVKDGQVLGQSFRGATGSGEHAEYGLIKKLHADCPVSPNLAVPRRSDDRLLAIPRGRSASMILSVAGFCVTQVVSVRMIFASRNLPPL